MCSWPCELRQEEIAAIQQEVGGGRCFRQREQDEQAS